MSTTTTGEHSIWWQARKPLIALVGLVVVAMVISVLVLANAYFSLARQQDIANCKSLYSTPLSNERDLRSKIILQGLHDLGANDPAGVAKDTASTPVLEKKITALLGPNNRAVQLAVHDPAKFLSECHSKGR